MIEDARIFLLDLNPSRGLGKELQAILESSFNFDIQLKEKPAGTSVASCCSHDHLSIISHFGPDLIFLVLSPGQFKHLRHPRHRPARARPAPGGGLRDRPHPRPRRLPPPRGAHGDRQQGEGRPLPLDPLQRERPRGPARRGDLLPQPRLEPARHGDRRAREQHGHGQHERPERPVRQIFSSKMDESSRFADQAQRSLHRRVARRYRDVPNLGVKQARFYVLIGAEMPSILAEVSFINHKTEGRRLADPAYRQLLAEALAEGVRGYAKTVKTAAAPSAPARRN